MESKDYKLQTYKRIKNDYPQLPKLKQDLQITKQYDYLIKWIKDATTRVCETERKYL